MARGCKRLLSQPVAAIASVATMQNATRGDFCPNCGNDHCCEFAEQNVRMFTQGKITQDELMDLEIKLDCELAVMYQYFLLESSENLPLESDSKTATKNMKRALH